MPPPLISYISLSHSYFQLPATEWAKWCQKPNYVIFERCHFVPVSLLKPESFFKKRKKTYKSEGLSLNHLCKNDTTCSLEGGRGLWRISQPTTRGRSVWFGFAFVDLSYGPAWIHSGRYPDDRHPHVLVGGEAVQQQEWWCDAPWCSAAGITEAVTSTVRVANHHPQSETLVPGGITAEASTCVQICMCWKKSKSKS